METRDNAFNATTEGGSMFQLGAVWPLALTATILLLSLAMLWRARVLERQYRDGQLHSMMRNAPEAILILDVDAGHFVLANERAADLFGLTMTDLMALGPADLSPATQPDGRNSADAIHEYLEATIQGETPAFEWSHQNALGGLISCEVRLIRVASQGRILVRGSVVDISDRLWAENALRRSEERFRAVIEAQEEFVVRWLPDGIRTFVNPAYCRDSGKSEDRLLGTSLLDDFDDANRHQALRWIDNLTPTEPSARSQYRSARGDGRVRWHEWTHRGLFDSAGRLVEVQSVGRDVTERKSAEAEAQKSWSLLMAAIDQTPAGILIADAPDANIRIANSAAIGIRGAVPKSLDNLPEQLHPDRWQVFHPDGTLFKQEDLPLSRSIRRGETVRDCDAIIRRADGEERWVLCNAAPVRNADNEIVAGVLVFPDVTRRRRLEMAVRSVVEITSALTGPAFFDRMVAELSDTLGTEMAFVGELLDGKRVRMLVAHGCEAIDAKTRTDELTHTAGAEVVGKRVRIYPQRVQELFPQDRLLAELGAVGYAAAPLFDRRHHPMGIIAVLSRSPIRDLELCRSVLEIFAIRTGAEMDRSRTDIALRHSEERFRKIFDESPIGAAIIDQHGRIRRVNDYFRHSAGYTQRELLQKRFGEFLHLDDVPKFLDGKRKLVDGDIECDTGELRLVRRDGGEVWVNTSMRIISDPTGEPLFLTMLEDISARKAAEQALQERLELEQFVVGLSSTFVGAPAHQVDREINRALRRIGEFFDVDRIALREFRNERGAVLTHGWIRQPSTDKIADLAMDDVPQTASKVLLGEVIQFTDHDAAPQDLSDEAETLSHLGIKAYLAIPLRVGDSLVGAFTLGSDRSSRSWPPHLVQWLRVVGEMFAGVLVRRRAEQRLIASREKLRALAAELTRVEAQERRQIATYLHDQIGQALAVLRMKFGVLTADPTPEVFDRTITQIRQLLHETIQDMQSLTFDLSPPVLHELGLRAAIEWVGERMAYEHGLEIEIDDQDFEERLDPDVATLLFRAVRELLINIVKHAGAQQTYIRLRRTDDELVIAVEDNGVGFDTEVLEPRADTTHFGLFSIRERLHYVGGRMEVKSTPGIGTYIVLIAPTESVPVTA